MDFKDMGMALGIGEEDFFDLVQLLVVTSHSDLDRLEQGLFMGESDKVAQAAHSIKGAAGTLGFTDIAAMAAKMEDLADQEKLDQIKAQVVTMRKSLDSLKQLMDRS